MLVVGLGCTMLIGILLVAGAVQAVGVIDAAGNARETAQVEHAIASYGGTLNYITLDAMQGALDLEDARLATLREIEPSELSVGLGGDRVVAWTPHRFGAQTFSRLAPTRIGLGLVFVLVVAIIAFYMRRVGRQLEDKRQEATHLAFTDSLTGLGNRLALEAALNARLAKGEGFAVILADLDRFKAINDAYGHATGDLVLKHVARQLRGAGRVDAVRIGGDEFAVLCPASRLDDYIASASLGLAAPLALDGIEITVGVSFGVARSDDFDPSMEALMHAADAALYRAKRRGGATAERATPIAAEQRYAA